MSILKRTVFYDNTNALARFWDWALVETPIGQMAEPFQINQRDSRIEFDPTDDMSRIDEMRAKPIDKELLVLSGGQHQLHGGYMLPRGNNR